MHDPINPLGRLFIAESPGKGRGVFTALDIEADELIELCPMIPMPGAHIAILDKTALYDYYFLWQDDCTECAIALGYGSIYNHSDEPNAEYLMHFDSDQMSIVALRYIEAGEEITVNYHGFPEGRGKLWFEENK